MSKSVKMKQIKKSILRDRQLYLFLLLPIVHIIVFSYVPMGGLIIAFKDYSARKGIWASDWVGLTNFVNFFRSYQFGRLMRNTIMLSLYSIIAGFPVPIIFALIINALRSEKHKKVTQTLTCLPHFISTTVMVGILYQLLSSRTGLYGQIAEALTGQYPVDLFSIPSGFLHIYVWSGVWQGFGWDSIVYVAALSGVDPEYHDAARIDGANRFQRVIHVDIPSILPTITILLILRVGNIMSLGFEKVLLLQNDLNLEYSNIISTYVYEVGLAGGGVSDFSYATAIGMFNSVVNLIMITIVNHISKKVSETSLW